jgi:peptidoglycan hydrolase-like protein with peptidoglycan-binding domain
MRTLPKKNKLYFIIGLFCLGTMMGCDFIYGLIQKEGAQEKEILGEIVPLQPNEKVREVQTLLKLYGYSAGQPDGTLGNNTRVAIGKFQEDNGLKVTRFVDYETWGRLQFHKDIGLIRDGKLDIAVVQTALKKAGFDPGKIDGYAGDKTWEALKDFQKARRLKPDGQVGLKTMRELAQFLY